MSPNGSSGSLSRLLDMPIARAAAYYVLLFAVVTLVAETVPGARAFLQPVPTAAGVGPSGLLETPGGPVFAAPEGAAVATLLSMAAAGLLMLPVAWIYIMTRQKKGYRQSVVQTLIILAVVVAGVVILVKNSLALAFSLGGIVAAVSFRNNLRDTKDAVCIFLATGVGLAAGVQAFPVAAALSVSFNVVIILLWWSDFGRAPARFEGPPAQQRLRRAVALANRTGAFVSMVDREILKSLAPEQLEALAERARRRRRRGEEPVEQEQVAAVVDGADRPRASLSDLRLEVTGELAQARRAVEPVLDASVKKWEFLRAGPSAAGRHFLEYRVRLKKKVPAEQLVPHLQAAAAPHVGGATVRPGPQDAADREGGGRE
jgi:hypothetical protein